MADLTGKRIAILATHGFEQSELLVPRDRLREMGAEVHVVSPDAGPIRGWKGADWGESAEVDRRLEDVNHDAFHALVLPGGQINPDLLRANRGAVDFVKAFHDAKKPIAAICHGPWLLIEAGIVRGRRATSFGSIRTDMINAGARWEDEAVICDEGIVTSRKPEDLDAFVNKIAEEVLEGKHHARAA
ncbi:type 1 glutamine amidotransferase domain-containing protein [Albimonas pacifica]|uniref:Protease I n=1 Tax=Albimonas pacifica TaxID=1114924 RepID=A0A1I3E1Y4_9RHOB|nr:type 1 glutamine amidotransferase domain-containing protein [Albimonas pacifica]SFH92976.1 protease I [Albimonas pacifica]